MEQLTLKLSELKRPEKNIRIHTEKQLKEFERSVKMFGQIRPLVVDDKNVVLAGNGLLDTLERLGYETALVYKFEGLTANQKKKLMIADNKIYSLGIENLDTLNSFLEEMHGDLDIPGFDEDILKQMVADTEEITEKLSEYGKLDETEIEAIRTNAEKKEQKMEQEPVNQNPTALGAPVAGNAVINTENVPFKSADDPEGEEPANIKKFVICPKCGEKIWL